MMSTTMLDLTPDEVLATTRSVRKRLDLQRPVEREVLEECLRLAQQAPTASYAQNWHFVVVTDAAELAALPPGVEPGPELREIRWMIEELRVGLYAHPMRTRYPISIKRIQKAIDDLPR